MAKKRAATESKETKKQGVISYLYERYRKGQIKDGIVKSDLLHRAMVAYNKTLLPGDKKLGTANKANFLKDIIRSERANSLWPIALKRDRVSARQRYGSQRVFQFVKYASNQTAPFPDRFKPKRNTPVHAIQSASMSFVARRLGREEETWLTQIAVNLRIVETQLSIFSPLRERLRDVTHLQMGVKTQPEIDAVYLASFGETKALQSSTDLYMLVTCEAKQAGQRILEDQIREQIAKGMEITEQIDPPIDAVKPMAVQVIERDFDGKLEKTIYVVEFEHVTRKIFSEKWQRSSDSDERLYSMRLKAVSQTIYRISPPIAGLNA